MDSGKFHSDFAIMEFNLLCLSHWPNNPFRPNVRLPVLNSIHEFLCHFAPSWIIAPAWKTVGNNIRVRHRRMTVQNWGIIRVQRESFSSKFVTLKSLRHVPVAKPRNCKQVVSDKSYKYTRTNRFRLSLRTFNNDKKNTRTKESSARKAADLGRFLLMRGDVSVERCSMGWREM